MSIVRTVHNKNNPYVMLNKNALEDKNLSWAAKGLWAYLMSRPDNWNISVKHLSKIYDGKGGGEKAIYTLLDELITFGYCHRKQPKAEKGQFSRVEYVITEFKYSLPHSPQRDAVEADAVEGSYNNKGSVPIKEEQQQDAAVFYEHKIFDCLKDVDIPRKDKVEISERYDEETVKHAIAWATHPETKVNKTLAAALKWGCKNKPEIPKSKDDEVKTNKDYAKKFDGMKAGCCTVNVLNNYVEIDYGTPHKIPFSLQYSEKGFKDQLNNALKKANFQH